MEILETCKWQFTHQPLTQLRRIIESAEPIRITFFQLISFIRSNTELLSSYPLEYFSPMQLKTVFIVLQGTRIKLVYAQFNNKQFILKILYWPWHSLWFFKLHWDKYKIKSISCRQVHLNLDRLWLKAISQTKGKWPYPKGTSLQLSPHLPQYQATVK